MDKTKIKFKKDGDGEYIPSIFTCYVETKVDIESITPYESPTLMHEYIHFLQDIFTADGYYRILKTKDYLDAIRIQAAATNELCRPYRITNQTIDDNDDFITDRIYPSEDEPTLPVSRLYSIPSHGTYEAYYVDSEDKEYRFGSQLISECMADSIEQRHPKYHEKNKNFDFPYKILASALRNRVSIDIDIIIPWLCFVALNSKNPGHAAVWMINNFDSNITSDKPLEFYDYICRNSLQIGFDHQYIFSLRYNALEAIKKLFTGNQLDFGDNILYAANIFDPSSAADFVKILIYLAEPIQQTNPNFSRITEAIGIPLYYNKSNDFASFGRNPHGGSGGVSLFTLHAIIEVLTKHVDPICPFIDICKLPSEWRRETICSHKPWRFRTGGEGCHYSITWKKFGLPESI